MECPRQRFAGSMASALRRSTNTNRSSEACPFSDAGITCRVIDVSDARKLKSLEDENAKLKKLLAEQMLDNAMLEDVNSKKW